MTHPKWRFCLKISHFFSYIRQIQDMLDNGAPISGIGCQGHFGPKSIDLNKVEDSLNKLWKRFGIPIWITEFDWANSDSDANNHEQHAIELENFYKLILRYIVIYFFKFCF